MFSESMRSVTQNDAQCRDPEQSTSIPGVMTDMTKAACIQTIYERQLDS
jgi:hypothetical protein